MASNQELPFTEMEKIGENTTIEIDGDFCCSNCKHIKDHSQDVCEFCSGPCENCKEEPGPFFSVFVGFEMFRQPIFFCRKCLK